VDFNPRLKYQGNLIEFRRNGAYKSYLNVPFLRNFGKWSFFHPWIEIHGYNIDRAYGTFKSLELVGNGQSLKREPSLLLIKNYHCFA
jgi:hypothetical protein